MVWQYCFGFAIALNLSGNWWRCYKFKATVEKWFWEYLFWSPWSTCLWIVKISVWRTIRSAVCCTPDQQIALTLKVFEIKTTSEQFLESCCSSDHLLADTWTSIRYHQKFVSVNTGLISFNCFIKTATLHTS